MPTESCRSSLSTAISPLTVTAVPPEIIGEILSFYCATNARNECQNLSLSSPSLRKFLKRNPTALKITDYDDLEEIDMTIRQFAAVYRPPCIFGDIDELYLLFPFNLQDQEMIKGILQLLNYGIRKLTIHGYHDDRSTSPPDFLSFLKDTSSSLPKLRLLKIVYDWELEDESEDEPENEPEDASIYSFMCYRMLTKALC